MFLMSRGNPPHSITWICADTKEREKERDRDRDRERVLSETRRCECSLSIVHVHVGQKVDLRLLSMIIPRHRVREVREETEGGGGEGRESSETRRGTAPSEHRRAVLEAGKTYNVHVHVCTCTCTVGLTCHCREILCRPNASALALVWHCSSITLALPQWRLSSDFVHLKHCSILECFTMNLAKKDSLVERINPITLNCKFLSLSPVCIFFPLPQPRLVVLCSSKMLQHIRVIYNSTTNEGPFRAVDKSTNTRLKGSGFGIRSLRRWNFFSVKLHSTIINIVLPSTNYLILVSTHKFPKAAIS